MNQWSKLAGVLGIVYCIAGFFLIFLGWNGAASYDREAAQIPYLISGGLAGLGLIVLGSALVVARSLRTDRIELRAAIDELRNAIETVGDDRSADAPDEALAAHRAETATRSGTWSPTEE